MCADVDDNVSAVFNLHDDDDDDDDDDDYDDVYHWP